ncbi:dicarboxylate/amino acid:cation symporter [Paremcibacter congregatus]|uniref:Sodium:dicarboxylate symporter n=1 Tax=Paremcibacter congregatus TaxID=2043170 RepID=A0A2G4YSQ0_9PROT|nr:dicarboxylate/amino acid:cation symporter [Paremcibacter congregatus]PHZ85359.1 sodium:dicarboxylate symporter [Paremcibacter congregatus]QDE27710.1 dicarboxylate/amino acid:cation symporter [Paremcibacter congregatus]
MSHKHSMIVLYLIVVGMVAGLGAGWFFGEDVLVIKWMGTLFLNALKMTIVPLILAAVISGVASLGDIRKLGRPGGLTMLYYLSTTVIAIIIGLVLVNLIQPGVGVEMSAEALQAGQAKAESNSGMTFSDILLSLISPNLVKSAVDLQLLPLVFFAVIFGAAVTTVGTAGGKVIDFFEGLNDAMMKIVGWIMYFAPIGVFALVATSLGEAGGGEAFLATIYGIGKYVATVLIALAVHSVVLFLIMMTMSGRGVGFVKDMARALLTAFGTASSSATLPLTMECAHEHGLSERSVRFVLPLGSTVNMNGTALYEAIAAMFIAQMYGIDLGIGAQILIVVTATLAAIGAAGIPQAGTVTMLIVLGAVGLPAEGIGILLSVDWFLDRFRTTVNVWGDSVGAAVMNKYMVSKEEVALEEALEPHEATASE